MNDKSLKTLEYYKITELLVSHATSDPGRKLCRELVPMTAKAEIETALSETSAACDRIRMKGPFNFGDTCEMGDSFARLKVEASLSMAELWHISRFLQNVARAVTYGKHDDDETDPDALEGYFRSLDPLTLLSGVLSRCILSEDEMADAASPELARIRGQLRTIQGRMRDQLNSILNAHREYLTEPVIAIRDGAYCLPVRVEYRSKVPGIIHDQSATGVTLFIEPMAVINLNNSMRELEASEKQEIARILEELSLRISPCVQPLSSDLTVMSHLDFVFAKAGLSGAMHAEKPLMNDRGIIDLKKARHPLLPRDRAVPIDIRLGETYDLLVVTGPNTGGKTVSLKTVGLLTLMAQSGLHIPAFEGSRMAVFTEVYADIGDEQSIEQSLSTFSGHMRNIVEIVNKADSESLCLFDELGAGTDPTEGAALAISILSFLHRMQVRTMATTHYSELKVFALNSEGVENAACEFDVNTLRPTYRILIGVPGKSNAFAISKKLGLPQHIIDEAGEHIEKDAQAMEDLISRLETERIRMEKEKGLAETFKREAQSLKDKLRSQEEQSEARRDKILEDARREAQKILEDAKETADSAISRINKLSHQAGVGRDLEKERERIRSGLKDVESGIGLNKKPVRKPGEKKAKELHKGDRVHIISMNMDGTVSTLPNDRGMLFVQMGILRSQVSKDDIAVIDEPETGVIAQERAARSSFGGNGLKTMTISPEINLIGKNVDEAVSELDKYLDDALLAHLPQVRIIHGRGTGALKSGIHAYLKKQKYVKSFALADFEDGGEAITIVKF